MAQVAEVSGCSTNTQLGTGFARFSDARFPWVTRYDEVILVLDGEMAVTANGARLLAKKHDCIWIPRDTQVIYEAAEALVHYAIHPATWS